MRIAAVLSVRDEVELIETSVTHLRDIGVDTIIACDIGSTDGTLEVLERYRSDGDFLLLQLNEQTTTEEWSRANLELARKANVDWVAFVDADEYLLPATGSLRQCEAFVDADIVVVDVFNVPIGPTGPLMPNRLDPVGYGEVTLIVEQLPGSPSYFLENPTAPFIRMAWPPTVMVRPERIVHVMDGAHSVVPVEGASLRSVRPTDLLIAHVPFSTRVRFARKIDNIRRFFEIHDEYMDPNLGWHWRHWLALADQGRLDEEFDRNVFDTEMITMLRAGGVIRTAWEVFQERKAVEAAIRQERDYAAAELAVVRQEFDRATADLAAERQKSADLSAGVARLEERCRVADMELASARHSLQYMAELQNSLGEKETMLGTARAVEVRRTHELRHSEREIARLATDCREAQRREHELEEELRFAKKSWLFKLSQIALSTRRQVNAAHRRLRVGRVEPLFAARWYLRKYLDVARSASDPFHHYLLVGAAEGRDPHPLFRTAWYLAGNPDVAGSGINALVHFVRHGAHELRNPHPLLDCAWYVHCPDARLGGRTPLEHYLAEGAAKGLDPHPLFDTSWYLASNPDVAASGTNPLVHFIEFGAGELRNPHPLFDCSWYVETYPDILRAGVNPLEHYLTQGASESRDPSAVFDTDWYRATYPEVGSINPLVHYVLVGAPKGLKPSP